MSLGAVPGQRWQVTCLLGACALIVTQRSASTEVQAPPARGGQAPPQVVEPLAAREVPRARAEQQQPMLHVPGGEYRPFYRPKQDSAPLQVAAFWLDASPVTQGNYAAFVAADPGWQRARAEPLFVESAYLSDWPSDVAPNAAQAGEPVRFVSWFAAKDYCAWQGKRLPTVVEWERAALASKPALLEADASIPARWEWTLDFNSVPVASGEDDPGSATSMFCGAGARASDARDYAAFLRYAFRSSLKASYTLKNLGFRCAKDAAG